MIRVHNGCLNLLLKGYSSQYIGRRKLRQSLEANWELSNHDRFGDRKGQLSIFSKLYDTRGFARREVGYPGYLT